jgi:hypothetical protein
MRCKECEFTRLGLAWPGFVPFFLLFLFMHSTHTQMQQLVLAMLTPSCHPHQLSGKYKQCSVQCSAVQCSAVNVTVSIIPN